MIIHEPEIILAGGEVTLSARVETRDPSAGLPDTLWFKYPERFAPFVSTRADAFLSALILVAQTLGEPLQVAGEVSPRLLYGLDEYQQIFAHWKPAVFHAIQIHAPKLSPAPAASLPGQFACGFSAGVDSFFTLHQGLHPIPGKAAWPVTHGLFIHGSPDIPLLYQQKYQALVQPYVNIFTELGLDLITASTNLMHFSANRIEFKAFLEAPLIGCALGLSPLLSGMLMSAGRGYRPYSLTGTGPITAHLLHTEAFETQDSGSAFTRLEKILEIASWAPAQKQLRVCLGFQSDRVEANCSECGKCLRTRLDLYATGQLHRFETLKNTIGFRDYLRWGRWLDISFGWEKDLLKYARKQRKEMVLPLLVGISIGYVRGFLRKMLPYAVQRQIFKLTSNGDPHRLFAQNARLENPAGPQEPAP